MLSPPAQLSPLLGPPPAPGPLRSVHVIHHPVGAKAYIEPVVAALNAAGIAAELWIETKPAGQTALAQLQVPHRVLACDWAADPLRAWSMLHAFRAHVRALRPQVVHCHQTRGALLPLLAAGHERAPLAVYHNHGLPFAGAGWPLRWPLLWLEKLHARLADRLLFVSPSTLQLARDAGVVGVRQAELLGDGSIAGVAVDDFAPSAEARHQARRDWQLATGDVVFGFVGRPTARKGFGVLLRAWRRAQAAGQGGRMLLAGVSAADVAQFGGGEGVLALGYVTDMPRFWAACDVAVLPSRSEGLPTSLLEGAAAGCALLATAVPGNIDGLADRQTGLLVPPEDADALAAAMAELLGDGDLRARLGAAAQTRVREKFARERVLQELVAWYSQVLAETAPQRQPEG